MRRQGRSTKPDQLGRDEFADAEDLPPVDERLGERDEAYLTQQQLDFRAGKTDGQKAFALKAKEVRRYIAKNPGQTKEEIEKGTGIKGCLLYLFDNDLAYYVGGKNRMGGKTGPACWYVKPLRDLC
jgi:hypothetical protein